MKQFNSGLWALHECIVDVFAHVTIVVLARQSLDQQPKDERWPIIAMWLGPHITTEAGHVLSSKAAPCGSPSAGAVLTAEPQRADVDPDEALADPFAQLFCNLSRGDGIVVDVGVIASDLRNGSRCRYRFELSHFSSSGARRQIVCSTGILPVGQTGVSPVLLVVRQDA